MPGAVQAVGGMMAFIPARGGSLGIPQKNIVDLGGRPLIAYAIDAARRAERIDRVVVSTDDAAIAGVARQWGAEVPFLRPGNIAGHRARLADAITFTLDELWRTECYSPEGLTVLCPTHPFRTPELLDELLGHLAQGYTRASTMKPVRPHARGVFRLDDDGGLHSMHPETSCRAQVVYRPYGLVVAYHLRPQPLGEYCHPLHDPVQLVDIDTYEDLYLAREIVSRGLFPVPEAEAVLGK